jgi:excisionase family DNA binding protein
MDTINQEQFNVAQAAKFLHISPKTIRTWAQKGYLKGHKVGPRGDWRFTKEQLENMIKRPETKTWKK